MSRHTLPSLAALLLLLLSAPPALAQANYDSALIGGHSSLFGGTGVATGTDAAAPLQNPATTVDIEGTSFVFSTIFMQLSAQNFDGLEDDRSNANLVRGSADLSQINFRVLPNSTCVFVDAGGKPNVRAGRHKLSVCFAEPERQEFDGSAHGVYRVDGQETWYRDRDIYYYFSKRVYAAGWAYALTDDLSIGVTPMLQEIRYKDSETLATLRAAAPSVDELPGATGANISTHMSQNAEGFAGSVLAGIQFRPSKTFQAGLSIESPAFHLFGSYRATRSAETLGGVTEEYSQEDGTARFQYPFRLALGVARKWQSFSVELSAYFHGPRGNFAVIDGTRFATTLVENEVSDFGSSASTRRESVRAIANLGVGVEVPVDPEWSLLFGALTDFSGLEPRQAGLPSDSTLFRSQNNLVHGSVGASWNPPVGQVLFGLRGYYGTGGLSLSSALTADSERLVLDETLWGLSLVLSGQLSLEMLAVVDPTGLLEAETKKPKNSQSNGSEESEAGK